MTGKSVKAWAFKIKGEITAESINEDRNLLVEEKITLSNYWKGAKIVPVKITEIKRKRK